MRSVYEAFTRHNYFPNQKEGEHELPPCFTTRRFTPELVEMIVKELDSKERRVSGYDQVEYLLTRHNNVPRKLGIIHPKAYAMLSKLIADNWEEINTVISSENSVIKPEIHTDGRILIMNYDDLTTKVKQSSSEEFSKRFRVHTDISSCYHSIYSHSLPWAAIGFRESKALLKGNAKKDHWSECLDTYTRKSKRNETLGVAIGPASSNIVVELILGRVDQELRELGFKFKRYIDDYICNTDTYEEAEAFLNILGKKLNGYKLNLNLHKTKIVDLPEPRTDGWVSDLAGCLPSNFISDNYERRKYTLLEVVNYLDRAVRLNKVTPDGSVLKYAIKSIVGDINEHSLSDVLDYTINLAWHFPLILPLLDSLLSSENVSPSEYEARLSKLVVVNANNSRSDGMAWSLYYIKKFNLKISTEACGEVIRSKDCVAMLCLYRLNVGTPHIVEFANNLLCKTEYEKDQYWLLLYELYHDDKIGEVYKGDGLFELMKSNGVTFMPEEGELSKLEMYCNYVDAMFPPMGINPCDFSDTIFLDSLDYKSWCKAPTGYITKYRNLEEVVLPIYMLSDEVEKAKWMPLIDKLNRFINGSRGYDWSSNSNFISLLGFVIRTQLGKLDYPRHSYEFTVNYFIERAILFYRGSKV
jgi:hypothetical protein